VVGTGVEITGEGGAGNGAVGAAVGATYDVDVREA
jgi:hypothetical protein